MSATMEIPQKGDAYTVVRRPGTKLWQHRPFECRQFNGCQCGENCDGVHTEYPGTVERVSYFADNSIEVHVRCEDGELRHEMLKPPSGDRCF